MHFSYLVDNLYSVGVFRLLLVMADQVYCGPHHIASTSFTTVTG